MCIYIYKMSCCIWMMKAWSITRCDLYMPVHVSRTAYSWKGLMKGVTVRANFIKFLHTQTISPKQSLTTMIRDMSVVAKLMQMVDANGGKRKWWMQMVEAFQVLWMEGFFIKCFFWVHFFGWNFRPRVQEVEWITNQPEHPSPTSHHPFLASTGAGMSPGKGVPAICFIHIWSLFLQH